MGLLRFIAQLNTTDARRSIGVGGVLVVAVVVLGLLGAFRQLEYDLYDLRIRHANALSPPPSDEIVHVAIDDIAVEELGRWPWRRSVIADAIRALDALGARTIVFDLIYEQEAFPEWRPAKDLRQLATGQELEGLFVARSDDDDLADAIANAGNVIIGVRTQRLNELKQSTTRASWRRWQQAGGDPVPDDLQRVQQDPPFQFERIDPISAVREAAYSLGMVSFDERRSAGNVHEFQAEARFYDGQRVPALGLASAAHYLGVDPTAVERYATSYRIGDLCDVPLSNDGYMRVPWLPRRGDPITITERDAADAPIWMQAHRVISIVDIIEPWQDFLTQRRVAAAISADLVGDDELVAQLRNTPVGPLPQAFVDQVDAEIETRLFGATIEEVRDYRKGLIAELEESGGDQQIADEITNLNLIVSWSDVRSVLDARANLWDQARRAVADKLVFIGIMQTGGLYDIAPSPLGEQTPGVTAHAAMAQGVLTAADPEVRSHLLRSTPPWLGVALSVVLGMLSAVASTLVAPKRAWIVLLSFAIGVVAFNVIAFDVFNTVFELATPLISIASAFFGCTTYRAIQFRRERAAIRAQFAARVSPQLVDILVENPGLMNMAGESREITTVFTDFAGFTAVSESLSDQEIVGIINLYLREIAEVMMAEGAYINKFLGDGIMAFWGAPTSTGDDVTAGLRTGVHLFDVMERVNDEQEARGFTRLGMRVGMSTGEVIVGDCGAPPKLNDYTVIGDAVNLAARLESAAKQFGADYLITQETIERADPTFVERIHWRPIGKIRVVGQTKGKKIAEVVGWKHGDERDAEVEEWIEKTAEAVRLYQEGEYHASQDIWQDLVLYPRGAAGAIMYAERCAELLVSGAKEEMLPLRSK
ncbi:MAG: CHASE2 domain-containing protein [Planctomycetota bacterium]